MTRVVDYHEAIDKAGGNPELAKDLFGMLLRELPQLRENLLAAITRADGEAVRTHAHKLYGSTAYCSVPRLCQAAEEMDRIARGDDFTAIRARYGILETTIDELLASGPDHLAAAW